MQCGELKVLDGKCLPTKGAKEQVESKAGLNTPKLKKHCGQWLMEKIHFPTRRRRA